MQTEPESPFSVIANRAEWPPLGPSQSYALGPAKRSFAGNLADEIVLCLVEGRHPAGHEVDAVAARIWRDIQTGGPKIPWRDIVPGCRRHQRIIAAARAALGDRQGSSACRQGRTWRYE